MMSLYRIDGLVLDFMVGIIGDSSVLWHGDGHVWVKN